MVIKLKLKLKDQLKISYVIILVFAFVLIVLITNLVMVNRLRVKARGDLNRQSVAILSLIEEGQYDMEKPRVFNALMTRSNVDVLVPANIHIFTKDRTLIYSSSDEVPEKILRQLINQDLKDYIRVVKTIGDNEGFLVLIAPISYISDYMRILNIALFFAIVITIIVSIMVALVMERRMVKPMEKLSRDLKRKSIEADYEIEPIESGDELQTLYEAFMVLHRANEHYISGKKRFFQNASHALKTPLMSISGYAEGLLDGVIKEDVEVEEALEIIVAKSAQLRRTIDETLYLSKLMNEEIEMVHSEVAIMKLLRAMVADHGYLAKEKSIQLELGNSPTSMVLLGDENNLKKALNAVLENALRYAKSFIRIEAFDLEREVVIQIIDDGEGIKDSDLPHVFERFYKGPGGISGIGLALVMEIVEAHGGIVSARNGEMGGACFEIHLPKRTEQ